MPATILTLDGESAPVFANLQTIDFSALLSQDPFETLRLVNACKNQGFFYLNLNAPSTKSVLGNWDEVLKVMDRWFDQPLEAKMVYNKGTDLHGYKQPGTNPGAREGTKDGFETFRLLRRNIVTRTLLPDFVQSNDKLFELNDSFRDSEGRHTTAGEWHTTKFDTYHDTHQKQRATCILTGGMESRKAILSQST
ncbi:hypothetical protein HKX48_008515 [Thoreauomyces humboldtii]|nr:hypothetical protein HKX48_008515 [Thoreauomyces humboldtii]